jgi:hypothetical protein
VRVVPQYAPGDLEQATDLALPRSIARMSIADLRGKRVLAGQPGTTGHVLEVVSGGGSPKLAVTVGDAPPRLNAHSR